MTIYPRSMHVQDGVSVCVRRTAHADVLLVEGGNPGFSGQYEGDVWVAPQTHDNAELLRQLFPYTAPRPVLSKKRTIGLGDRLGLATPGHIRAINDYDVVPIFAQQSIRELNLTQRNYQEVLDAVTYAVFREGFKGEYGADGDHLKTVEEVEYAIENKFTCITLDCSDHLRNEVFEMSDDEVDSCYENNEEFENLYLNKEYGIEKYIFSMSPSAFKRCVLIYGPVIDFVDLIYKNYIKGKDLDFEVSIDEIPLPTTPEQHLFVANELARRDIKVATVAPRFAGEFQKGIDYIGDVEIFRRDILQHAAISREFGYKLSIHSGSDKFSIFPVIGSATRGVFHVKTAGTNWLEAMRVIAMTDPRLYRELHSFAIMNFAEASKYYAVRADLGRVPDISSISDDALPTLFEQDDLRQLIHITYGLILNAKNDDGTPKFRDRLYTLWFNKDNLYSDLLDHHIGKHLELLYRDADGRW